MGRGAARTPLPVVRFAVLLVGIVLHPPGALAAVSVGEVMTTCRDALAAGFRGVEAAACEWFLDPCAVCGVEPPPERWCAPPGLTAADRAERLLAALAQAGVAAAAPADGAVRRALAATFPCPAAGGE